jgi:hypothetical protein
MGPGHRLDVLNLNRKSNLLKVDRNNSRIYRVAAIGFLSFCLYSAPLLSNQVYWEAAQLLSSFFPDADRVTYRQLELSSPETTLLENRLHAPVNRVSWTIFVATDQAEEVMGYAVFDEELGEHMPISFAVQLDPTGQVVRQEVMVYREAFGEGVISERFRRQFVGRGQGDPFRDIDSVSGATISTHSMTRGTRRIVEVMGLILDTRQSELSVQPAQRAP